LQAFDFSLTALVWQVQLGQNKKERLSQQGKAIIMYDPYMLLHHKLTQNKES